jgi:hypothetical protein
MKSSESAGKVSSSTVPQGSAGVASEDRDDLDVLFGMPGQCATYRSAPSKVIEGRNGTRFDPRYVELLGGFHPTFQSE